MERISEKKIRVGSILVALMICSKLLNIAIPVLYSGGIQAGIITMGAIWGLYVIYILLFKIYKANLNAAIFIIFILLYFAVSNVAYSDHIRLLTLHFVEYGVVGFLIAGTYYDIEKVTRYTAYLVLLLAYPIMVQLHANTLLYTESMGMGLSYALLSPAFAILTHLLYYRRKNDYLMYLAYAFSAYLIYQILVRGIRGAILCVLVFAFFVMLNSNRIRSKFSARRGIVLLLVFIVILNTDTLFTLIANWLSSAGIHIRFIEKTLELNNVVGDVSNGRLNIYAIALNDFVESPVWGKGIGYFPEIHNINYPHNLILQVLGEGGLLLGIPIVVILVRIIYDLIFGTIEDRDLRNIVLLLTSCTIPAAFVSDEIWNYQLLWLLFGIFIKKVMPQVKRKKLQTQP